MAARPSCVKVVRHTALMLALAAITAGCTSPSAGLEGTGLLRNPTVILAGTTRFDPERFAGRWQTTACLGACAERVRYLWDGEVIRETAEGQAAYNVEGPGILRGQDTLVVMWVDDGFRTAAVGNADGTWAAVIDRKARAAPDRLAAATEILDFNGWDVAKLKVKAQ